MANQRPPPPLQNEKLIQAYQTSSKSQQLQQIYQQQMPTVDNVYWPKWDTYEIFRFDLFQSQWTLVNNARPQSKFLFFSSVAHLPKALGMFILGGSDSEDNFSKRTILFSRYQKFVEKPPMIYKRAFFPSLFCLSDQSLYAFGGHDGDRDINLCERYSLAENVWRQVAPMIIPRNGASVVAFDKVIFAFGGNNQEIGSLDTIERYAVEFDKWTQIALRLKEPVHDTIAFNVGGARALIFGGSLDGQVNTKFTIYDLTCDCLDAEQNHFEGGKIYLPPVYDQASGQLHVFQGYGDTILMHEKLKLGHLFCQCRSIEYSAGASSHAQPHQTSSSSPKPILDSRIQQKPQQQQTATLPSRKTSSILSMNGLGGGGGGGHTRSQSKTQKKDMLKLDQSINIQSRRDNNAMSQTQGRNDKRLKESLQNMSFNR